MKRFFLLFFFGALLFNTHSQSPTSSDIYEDIQKLGVLGTVMYVAAHPDDENTRLITYFANHLKTETVYLSLTRGDGGQNLIGPELRELLGVIRTQELLAARRIDGGNQFFTRANDFGYSKSPEESMEIWNRNEVLADVVWAIRKYQPDIIINRFNHDHNGRTHGHHTASAQLSYEAFDLSGRPDQFEYQLDQVKPWKAKRLYFNTSWWFYGSREAFEDADKSKMAEVDVGVYYPLKGLSNNEIAAMSRSMHKCQGFGSSGSRGSHMEYLQLLKGEQGKNKDNPVDELDLSWTRLPGGEKVGKAVDALLDQFDFSNPSSSIPQLVKIAGMIEQLPSSKWKKQKLADIDQLLIDLTGLYTSLHTTIPFATRGQRTKFELELTNRSQTKVNLISCEVPLIGLDTVLTTKLNYNEVNKFDFEAIIPDDANYTSPYWLDAPYNDGMYTVLDQSKKGLPEYHSTYNANLVFELLGRVIRVNLPVEYKNTDPVEGEIRQPLGIVPDASISFDESAMLFPGYKRKVYLTVESFTDSLNGKLSLDLPLGWSAFPDSIMVNITQKGVKEKIEFIVTPGEKVEIVSLGATLKSNGEKINQSVRKIEYDHIPHQYILKDAKLLAAKTNIETRGNRIGYIAGAGDAIPECLEQIGYQVEEIKPQEAHSSKLSTYDAIVVGIRAFNTVDEMSYVNQNLFNYVEEGGTVVVQYNTRHRLKTNEIGPYPIKLSRDRVTVEEAPVSILQPNHRLFNYPNRIRESDFDHWVQERGLYFPSEWDERYETLISTNDPGEDPKEGSILVTQHGKGYYIYTGLSFFRQLPAGVPGAYRLFANMVSIGQQEGP